MSYFETRWRDQAVATKEPVAAFPRNCLVEVTNACNHACVFCHNPFMHRKTGILDKSIFDRFAREAAALGLREIGLYSTGEPFLVKHLDWFVACAKHHGIQRVYVTTNGALATPDRVQQCVAAGLDSIKFSINAGTRESYQLVHGRDEFDLVVGNVRDIHAWKSKAGIKLQMLGSFVHTRSTRAEIDTHRALFSPYFEDIIYLQAQSQGGRTEGNIADIVDPREHPDLASVGPCEMLWNRVHLTCEGYLTACCVDYEHDLTYADYSAGVPLLELWNGPGMRELRQRHLDKNFDSLICKTCLLGGKAVDYAPLSDLRGEFGRKGKYQDDTQARIRRMVERLAVPKDA